MNPKTPERVGARRISEIPQTVSKKLQKGEIESANLVEWLSVDQIKLAESVFKELSLDDAIVALRALKGRELTALQGTIAVGELLSEHITTKGRRYVAALAQHESDSVRSWVCVALVRNETTLRGALKSVKPYANDPHMGVREIAWMAVRPFVEAEIDTAFETLATWAEAKEENLRRFCSEVSRPRGVWTKHIPLLKQRPELGGALLEHLRTDASKYVRDSVGNWLNDAAKSKPAWVRSVCARWRRESPTPETGYIIRRALRSL
jgi:3-methyladenine DNA glycosylase AlkC